ncbi:MAG: LVIVD repeat-containing protein [Cenarchaeum symbiont of Oopsacas minuta]|nr:LVIVD repeat-containing protein [Cenarchaeum symbiont of Oopsacas minuta]
MDTDPIAVTNLTIASNGNGNIHAREGQNVTITLTTDGTDIENVTGVILGRAFTTVTNSNGSATFTGLVISGDNGNATFSITVTNSSRNNVTITQEDITDTSFVTTDTTNPTITLNGEDTIVILQNSIYIDAGAIANDTSYGIQNITGIGTIDTSTIGIHTLSYKAPDDHAGNIGSTITRTVFVQETPNFDLRDYVGVTSLIIQSNNTNNEYAKLGDQITITLTANSTIGSITRAEIASSSATSSIASNIVTISKTVTLLDADTNNASFTITVTNKDNTTSSTFTNADLTGLPLVIDQTAPIITLYGANNTVIIQNSTYIDPGAISIDTSYGTQNITGTGTIDTSTIGIYTLSYKTPDDLAGNVGPTITRIIDVQDHISIALSDIHYKFGATLVGNITDSAEYPILDGANSIIAAQINGSTYALVTAHFDNGIQIIDITDPFDPSPVINITDIVEFSTLYVPSSITIAQINGYTYALVTVAAANGIQIIDISNPYSPSPVANVTDGEYYTELGGAFSITTTQINGSIYALVAAPTDDGVQIIDISNPYSPSPVASVTDDEYYTVLDIAVSITTAQINGSTYALVAARGDNGVQIIDITIPSEPEPRANITDSAEYPKLHGARSITTAQINGSTYALVAALTDHGVQIIDITDPFDPSPVANITDSAEYPVLDSASGITTAQIDGSTYALVAADGDDGVQIIDITIPSKPDPAANITDGAEYPKLDGAISITTIQINGSTFALVAAQNDDSVQIIKLGDVPIGTTTPLLINSSNGAYASVGDIVTVKLNINATITSYITNIISSEFIPAVTTNGSSLDATITIPSTPIEEYATFNITVANSLGASLDITQENLPSNPNIFVDTISPRISLVNSTSFDIIRDTIDLAIPGATVQDGDPNYSGNYTVTTNGTLDTSLVGSTVLYTYTADADAAGNLGDNVTRIVTIVNPDPITVTNLTITSNGNGNIHAREGQNVTITLTTDGTDLENVTGVILGRAFTTVTNSNGSATFTGLVVSGDNGNATFSITVTNSSGNEITVTQDDITDDTFVTTDTIKPVITLTGNTVITIFQNDSYVELGSSISDSGNPTYTGTVSTTSIDTSILGIQNITYTGTADAAGNTPDAVNRTITIQAKPLDVTSLTIQSDNANNAYAKLGDQITATLTVNGTIGTVTLAEIESSTVTPSTTTNTVTINKTVTSSDADTNNASFTITVTNEDNTTTITFTNADLTGSPLVLDQTAPIITLYGANNTAIIQNSTYIDPRAIAIDTSYGTQNITGTGTIDTSTIGIYTLSYKTPDDLAGNMGPTITRIIDVQDHISIALSDIHYKFGASPVTSITDSAEYPVLDEANSITTAQINGSTYALVIAHLDNGIQIIDISNPYSPSPVANVTDGVLDGVSSITTAQINGSTYALVTAFLDDGVQIIDISNPYSPSLVANVTDGVLDGARSITTAQINGSTYALVTAFLDDGVQIIDISNPYSPSLVANVTDGVNYTELHGAYGITTAQIDGSTYALVTTLFDHGVQIIDISNPYSPSPVASATDGVLDGVRSITTAQINGSTYALVAAFFDDGVQIIDITIPSKPDPVANITDSVEYPVLNGASSITTAQIDGSTYALVAAVTDNGVQIIDITIPSKPDPVANITDGAEYLKLNGTIDITTTQINGSTFALVVAENDDSVQIIKLGDVQIGTTTPLLVNSSNGAYASVGDIVTVKLNINATIASYTTNITNSESTQTVTTNGSSLDASITIPSTPIEEYATFNITVANSLGASLDITQEDLPSNSNIFVDTISPRISLIGSANHTIIVNATDPIIPGAIVQDGDPNYSGTYNVTKNGTLDTSTIGSTVLYTYTADADGAGNPDQSTTRTVTVVDAEPINITALTITSNGNDNIYAKEGQIVTVTLTTDGTDLGNVTGTILGGNLTSTSIDNGTATFTGIVESGDNGNATFSITVTNSSRNQITVTQDNITDDTFVTLDTIKPVITLNGGVITIFQNDPYVDPGSSISDSGNPTYTGTVSATLLDTSILGVQNITYTGTADAAGNIPDAVNRTITIQAKPLGVTSLTIQSDNANNAYAKLGDQITVTLTVNGTIGSIISVNVGSTLPSFSIANDTVTFNQTITSSDTDTNNTSFSIIVVNEDNKIASVFTNTDLTGSPLVIDQTAPIITLYGANNTAIIQNSTYIDPGAIAIDTSYGTQNITGTGTIDTSTIGIYTLSYKTPDDLAGNVGPTITRIIDVQDHISIALSDIHYKFGASPVTSITNSTEYPVLDGASSITTAQINGSTTASKMLRVIYWMLKESKEFESNYS